MKQLKPPVPLSNLLYDLVSIYSPSTQEESAVNHLVAWMKAHEFDAGRDQVGNAVGVRGNPSAGKVLMLLGHIDTVPGIIDVRTENNRLYGRGSVDAKGALCAFAEATAQSTIPGNWQVVVVGAVEEEISSSKGARFVREVYQPDLCIIGEPSTADRITLGYKGRLLVDIHIEQPLAHTARDEPSAGAQGAEIWHSVRQYFDALNRDRGPLFEKVMCRLQSIDTRSDDFTEIADLTIGFRLPEDYPPHVTEAIIRKIVPEGIVLRFYGAERAYRGEKNNMLVRGLLKAIRQQGNRPAFVLKTGTSDMNVVASRWDCPMVAYGPGDSNLDHTPDEHLDLNDYAGAVNTLMSFINKLPE